MVGAIDHLNRYVSNVEEFINFYGEVLGYELIDRDKKANGQNYAILKGMGHELFISETENLEESSGSLRHLGYTVENIEKLVERLCFKGYVEKGYRIVEKKFSRQFYIKDPDGWEIDLIEWTDKKGFYASLAADKK